MKYLRINSRSETRYRVRLISGFHHPTINLDQFVILLPSFLLLCRRFAFMLDLSQWRMKGLEPRPCVNFLGGMYTKELNMCTHGLVV
jgi:hypothetical protein